MGDKREKNAWDVYQDLSNDEKKDFKHSFLFPLIASGYLFNGFNEESEDLEKLLNGLLENVTVKDLFTFDHKNFLPNGVMSKNEFDIIHAKTMSNNNNNDQSQNRQMYDVESPFFNDD